MVVTNVSLVNSLVMAKYANVVQLVHTLK
jgi:hypothetical protein